MFQNVSETLKKLAESLIVGGSLVEEMKSNPKFFEEIAQAVSKGGLHKEAALGKWGKILTSIAIFLASAVPSFAQDIQLSLKKMKTIDNEQEQAAYFVQVLKTGLSKAKGETGVDQSGIIQKSKEINDVENSIKTQPKDTLAA